MVPLAAELIDDDRSPDPCAGCDCRARHRRQPGRRPPAAAQRAGAGRPDRRGRRHRRRPRGGAGRGRRRPRCLHATHPAPGDHGDGSRRRSAGRRPVLPDRLRGRRRRRARTGVGRRRAGGTRRGAAGLGDPPVRTGEPRDRDDGPPPGGAPRGDRGARLRLRPPAAAPGDRRSGPGHPAAAGPAGGHGSDRDPPGAAGRRGGAPPRAGGHGVPARAPGRAPRRVRGARRHRRRLPLHRRRARPHRPLGRRGRPADCLLGQRPAVLLRPARRCALRLSRARRDSGPAPGRVGPGDAPALGRVGLGEPGRGRAVRRHGVVAALSRRHGAGPARPPAGGGADRPGGAAPHSRPRGPAARRGGCAGRDAAQPPGGRRRGKRRTSPGCTCPSSAC